MIPFIQTEVSHVHKPNAKDNVVAKSNPKDCEPPITAIAFRFLLRVPPKKSAKPQTRLESKARTMGIPLA
jgi:hypothetical protein